MSTWMSWVVAGLLALVGVAVPWILFTVEKKRDPHGAISRALKRAAPKAGTRAR
jgi:hypothetical protein